MTLRLTSLLASLLLNGVLTAAPAEVAKPEPVIPRELQEAQEAANAGDFEKAATLLKTEAEKGNADAAFALAEFYMLGRGVEASVVEALKWYERAGEAGNPAALARQGQIYLQGTTGVEADEDRAKFLLTSAAEAGVADAWTFLGKISESKAEAADALPDRERHFSEARDYHIKGAEAGNLESQELLARLLSQGLGGPDDQNAALDWLKRAAIAGRPSAMNELGLHYQRNSADEEGRVTALGWFLAGAERGSTSAMTNLGICYAKGIGVPLDNNQAGSWFAKASKLNFAPAQHLLGQMFEEGRGTEPNPVFAYVNYSRAAAAGLEPAAKARDAIQPKLTDAQRKEAEQLLKSTKTE